MGGGGGSRRGVGGWTPLTNPLTLFYKRRYTKALPENVYIMSTCAIIHLNTQTFSLEYISYENKVCAAILFIVTLWCLTLNPVLSPGITPPVTNPSGRHPHVLSTELARCTGRVGAAVLGAATTRLHAHRKGRSKSLGKEEFVAFPNDRAASIRPTSPHAEYRWEGRVNASSVT